MKIYEFLQVLIKHYVNDGDLGRAVRNIHYEINDYVHKNNVTGDKAVDCAIKEIINKNFHPH
jgi:hypothetical protein